MNQVITFLLIAQALWTGLVFFVGYVTGKSERPPISKNPLILPRPFEHGNN